MVTKKFNAAQDVLVLNGSDTRDSKIGFQLVGLTTGTFVAEASNDGGTTWVTMGMYPIAGGAVVTSITADGFVYVQAAGCALVRFRASALSSGTPTGYALPVYL